MQIIMTGLPRRPPSSRDRRGRCATVGCAPCQHCPVVVRTAAAGLRGLPAQTQSGVTHKEDVLMEGNVLFNITLNTFYLRLYGVRTYGERRNCFI